MFVAENGVVLNNNQEDYRKILAERNNKDIINKLQEQIIEVKKELKELKVQLNITCMRCLFNDS